MAGGPNVKPKSEDGVLEAAVVVDAEETVAEPDGVPVEDDELEVESEVAVDSEVDAESEEEGKADPVGIGIVPMVLATSFPAEEVAAVPDGAVAAPQSVADTVTVDTTVMVTMLSVPMTTVGVAIPFDAEEDVAETPGLEVALEMELETTDVELRVGSDDVAAIVGVDEDDKIWRRWRAVLDADVESVGDSVTVTVTMPTAESVELGVAELIVTEVGIAVVDELSSSPSSQSPSPSGSSTSVEFVVSFPVMPPWRPADTKR